MAIFNSYVKLPEGNGIFPYQPSSYWGTPIDGNPHMEILQWVNLVCLYEYVSPYIKTSS